jgi:two-component system NtrC family sensor kinase
VESALGIVENEFHLEHVDIGLTLDKDMINTLLDKNQIEQVVINLLLNALHAVDENGVVTVMTSVNPEADKVLIEVNDNGCGIAEADRKKIFEPFFSTQSSGTGLGLAISYGIIRNHGGDIRVSSTLGEGTRFLVEFPIQTDTAAREVA